MNYKVFAPPTELKELVQCFWTLESEPGLPMPVTYHLMADNCPEIIFQYNGGFKGYATQSARIRFQHDVYDKFQVAENLGFFGLRLLPHAAGILMDIPAHEVVNHVFNFAEIFKQDGADLADKIYNARDIRERINYATAFLLKRASGKRQDSLIYSLNRIWQSAGTANITQLQQQSGLSVKQFERRFKAVSGFTPKYFARLSRFQAIKDIYCNSKTASLTSLAYLANYYDQPHFNREFKEFSGVQPRKFLKISERTNSNKLPAQPDLFDGYLPCGWFI